jgi:hypothetical protein
MNSLMLVLLVSLFASAFASAETCYRVSESLARFETSAIAEQFCVGEVTYFRNADDEAKLRISGGELAGEYDVYPTRDGLQRASLRRANLSGDRDSGDGSSLTLFLYVRIETGPKVTSVAPVAEYESWSEYGHSGGSLREIAYSASVRP